MTTYKLDTSGLNETLQKLKNPGAAIGKVAKEIAETAANLAPVDTRDLRDSIEAVKVTQNTWWVQDGMDYGIYQELGTYKMAAQPFMVPAVEQAEAALIEILEKELFGA